MKLSVIIPVYNEERFIGSVIEKVRSVTLPPCLTRELIVVNDGSTDNTAKILERFKGFPEVKILHHARNLGKSAAVRTGIQTAQGDLILIQDADLECTPADYPRLLEPFLGNHLSVVYGSRFKGKIKNMSLMNRIANRISTATVNLLFRTKLSDVNTCYKVFRRKLLDRNKITSKHFVFDAEITVKLLKQGYQILEVPISYCGRSRSEGKKMNWLHALRVYWGIFKYRFVEAETASPGFFLNSHARRSNPDSAEALLLDG